MLFYLISFIAGVLTVLAPCVLPVLPVIIGGSLSQKSWRRPFIITTSLGVSIVLFTLILKASTTLIAVPPAVWKSISAGIIFIFGLTLLFPNTWTNLSYKLGLSSRSEELLQKAIKKESLTNNKTLPCQGEMSGFTGQRGLSGDVPTSVGTDESQGVTHSAKGGRSRGIIGEILIGAALGPVFASCSPTYFIILATILPASFTQGIINLLFYAAGLVLILFLITILGQKLIQNMKWAANPNGWFKKSLGILMVIVGIAIFTGYDKKAEVWLLENNINPGGVLEQQILDKLDKDSPLPRGDVRGTRTEGSGGSGEVIAPDLIGLQNWINTDPINSLNELRGKVVLIDFWTYSCINCIRTLPFLQAWHEKYKDDGLVVIGIHAPEFQFEKNLKNVKNAVQEYGLTYPIVQDNDFKTWRAYKNRYWPAKYLIDKDGNIRYTHFGEGAYIETEKKIQELLSEVGAGRGLSEIETVNITPEVGSTGQSPEIYFGAWRNSEIANGTPKLIERRQFLLPKTKLSENTYYLDGTWDIQEKYMENTQTGNTIRINFSAKKIFTVSRADIPVRVDVYVDGRKIQTITIKEDKLYTLFNAEDFTNGLLKLEILDPGLQLFTVTFG